MWLMNPKLGRAVCLRLGITLHPHQLQLHPAIPPRGDRRVVHEARQQLEEAYKPPPTSAPPCGAQQCLHRRGRIRELPGALRRVGARVAPLARPGPQPHS